MPKYNSPDQPIEDLDMDELPDPNISIPELDQIFGGRNAEPGNNPMTPPPEMPPAGPADAGGLPKAGPPMPPEGSDMAPGMSIASKMGKPQKDPEAQAIDLITTTIAKLNQLGDLLMGSDEANARSVRQMIRILGEILKSAEHGKPVASPPML